ncbi:ABC transporter ATP-binding protein [Phormidium sp. CLA17]|uniref:ABC transporter ATP-binding protein n=1 Tax=Leptolyngbya sp. Cla-17 TaxID=2803751 RepID=UPI001491D0DF|nr:ABC transporter ATP-binding protein [Leptolyngbya sp. Cla-17]MBM0743396.1 ABC transporter ATP-binding protein [Leptolyngbya sp. Cla-17]
MIKVEHLSKIYGTTSAIADVTFSVEPGEILGFLGPNGAGKTTTMRILSGYLPATTGTATVAGYEVHSDSMAVRSRIGYLPETPPLYPDMTVEGFLYFVARIKGVSAGERAVKVRSALAKTSLTERRTSLIRKLSKGYRQRVGIAQAIVHDPSVIILDEPTVGLDPRQIIEVRNLIKNLAGSHTVILSTHILPEVSMTCNRVAIIHQGRVVATNTPEQLMAQRGGGSAYELEIEGGWEETQRALQSVAGVQEVKPVAAELPSGFCRVRVVGANEELAGRSLAAAIVGSGLGLLEMRRIQASLEDVFLQLTMEDGTAEGADGEIGGIHPLATSETDAEK